MPLLDIRIDVYADDLHVNPKSAFNRIVACALTGRQPITRSLDLNEPVARQVGQIGQQVRRLNMIRNADLVERCAFVVTE